MQAKWTEENGSNSTDDIQGSCPAQLGANEYNEKYTSKLLKQTLEKRRKHNLVIHRYFHLFRSTRQTSLTSIPDPWILNLVDSNKPDKLVCRHVYIDSARTAKSNAFDWSIMTSFDVC